jgi:hypothetical protein
MSHVQTRHQRLFQPGTVVDRRPVALPNGALEAWPGNKAQMRELIA